MTAAGRTCAVCQRSIDHKRADAKTCADACKMALSRGNRAKSKRCAGDCGRLLEPGRALRRYCSERCRATHEHRLAQIARREPDARPKPLTCECEATLNAISLARKLGRQLTGRQLDLVGVQKSRDGTCLACAKRLPFAESFRVDRGRTSGRLALRTTNVGGWSPETPRSRPGLTTRATKRRSKAGAS
jgi:hypothetical protein